MTAGNRRVVRMLCKAVLLISLPLAGFAWALPETPSMMIAAAALSFLALVVGFGAEVLASSTESELMSLSQRITAESQHRAEELEARDEKLRQFDRMVGMLTEQNHSLRAKLISIQVELHSKRQARVDAAANALGAEDFAEPLRSPYAARAH